MRFHERHGSSVVLEENNTKAHRIDGFCDGIVFSEQPICLNTYYTLTTSHWDFWRGSLCLGFTTKDPNSFTELPKFISPNPVTANIKWVTFIAEDYLAHYKRLTFYVNNSGDLRLVVRDVQEESVISNVSVIDHVWLVIDIYGGTTSVKILQEHDAPLEVYAKGPSAVDTFNIANTVDGAVSTCRTKFVVIGKNELGKEVLKKELIHRQARDDVTSVTRHICGLQVSGWHRMTDNEYRPTKLPSRNALSGISIRSVALSPSSVEPEFYRNLATNLARGVLAQNKKPKKGNELDQLPPWPSWTLKTERLTINQETLLEINGEDIVGKYLSNLSPEAVVRIQQLLQNSENKQKLDLEENEKSLEWDENLQSVNIEFSIWDLDLNCLHHDLLQFIFTSRAIYLIVFDVNEMTCSAKSDSKSLESFRLDDLLYWLNCIHYYATPTVVPLVPNHDKLLPPPVILIGFYTLTDDEQCQNSVDEKLVRIQNSLLDKPFYRHLALPIITVEVDDGRCDDEMINKCHFKIQEVLRGQMYYGEEIPSSWLRFEKTLLNLQESLICHADLSKILEMANSEGIETSDGQKSMLAFYNDIGVLMHFNGTIGTNTIGTMSDTIIVNPLWLIDSFNKILTFGQHLVNKPVKTLVKAMETLKISGVLEENLIDFIWRDRSEHKETLLEMMNRLDLLCQKVHYSSSGCATITQQYYLPSQVTKEIENDPTVIDTSTNIVFYLDFIDFLPDGLFRRLLIRTIRWSLEGGGWSPLMFRKGAHLHLNDSVDLILEMQTWKNTLVKVVIVPNGINETINVCNSGNPHQKSPSRVCAMVRNFLESTLAGLRELWMKRLVYRTCVFCPCGRLCNHHQMKRCIDNSCKHFLLLDDCLANNVVLCDFNRVNTSFVRKNFPKLTISGNYQPILPEAFVMKTVNSETIILDGVGMVLYQRPTPVNSASNHMVLDPKIANCFRNMAKILNSSGEGRDWVTLALNLGYRQSKIDEFNEDLNPGLALTVDWLFSSGNTTLSTEMLISCLKRMENHDLAAMLTEMQDDSNEAAIFISYQWEAQDHVVLIRNRLEQNGLRCWMDIGQMGGGDLLYNRIYRGISRAKVVLVCITPKYVVSHNCAREASLADLLGKPIIPIMISPTPWPPPGPLAILFSQMIYIDLYGIGGHGGTGFHADWEDRVQEILNQIYHFVAPVYHTGNRRLNRPLNEQQYNPTPSPQVTSSTPHLLPLDDHPSPATADALPEPPALLLHEPPSHNADQEPNDDSPLLFQPPEVNMNFMDNDVMDSRPDSTPSLVHQNHVTKCSVCVIL